MTQHNKNTELVDDRITTGSEALDLILGGGIDANRLYLYEGRPGTGKTTLAMQFLLAGSRAGEVGLYIALSETSRELRLVADRHGWDLSRLEIFELVPPETRLDPDMELTVFHPAEMELVEATNLIFGQVAQLNPSRVVIDSLSELRLLAQSPLRYRRQILALKHFFSQRNCTVVILDDLTAQATDLQLHSIAHGVVLLEQQAVDYGGERRRLRVVKMRGVKFRGGFHDLAIKKGGLEIYPRLVADDRGAQFGTGSASSGDAQLDKLLGGGLRRGTSILLVGAAGVGKSSMALTFCHAAVKRGERCAYFAFDETSHTIEMRAEGIGAPVGDFVESQLLSLRQIDPAEMSPGEFAANVKTAVEDHGAKFVVIDSLNGYLNAMPDGRFLLLQLHEMLTYLGQKGVVTILVMAQHGLVGDVESPLDVSYLSDCALMLRYFEADGQIRRSVGMIKNRLGKHERTLREFCITSSGLHYGPPLRGMTDILSGIPRFRGDASSLLSLED